MCWCGVWSDFLCILLCMYLEKIHFYGHSVYVFVCDWIEHALSEGCLPLRIFFAFFYYACPYNIFNNSLVHFEIVVCLSILCVYMCSTVYKICTFFTQRYRGGLQLYVLLQCVCVWLSRFSFFLGFTIYTFSVGVFTTTHHLKNTIRTTCSLEKKICKCIDLARKNVFFPFLIERKENWTIEWKKISVWESIYN